MENDFIFDIEPFLAKSKNLNRIDNLFNVQSFIRKQVSLNEISDEMGSFFTNDKCNRVMLSSFQNNRVIISGRYERFGYSHPNNMSVQDCHFEIDGQFHSLGHMWWQNVYNSAWFNLNLAKGCYVTAIGTVNSYKCNDISFPCDKSYGISNVYIL